MAARGQTLKDFGNLYPAESKLLAACRNGEAADINDSRPEARKPENHVRADFIRFLARGGDDTAPVHEAGVNLNGAVVVGELDLSGATVAFPLRLKHCLFQTHSGQLANLFFRGSNLAGGLFLNGSHVKGVFGDSIHARDSLNLGGGFQATAKVSLIDAEITGTLQCGGGKFLMEKDEYALRLDGVKVSGCVFLGNNFQANGRVILRDSEIGSYLDCGGGKFEVNEGESINFERARVLGSVFLRKNFFTNGTVNFLGARIGGNLDCSGGAFKPTNTLALSFDRARISGSAFFKEKFLATGTVRFLGAQIESNLECDEGIFEPTEGYALRFDKAKIEGSVFLRNNFKASGMIRFDGAKIGGSLELTRSKIEKKIIISYVIIDKEFRLTELKKPLSGADLRNCHCVSLWDDETSWDANNNLNGFVYQNLAHKADAAPEFRVPWLKDQSRDKGSYRPQPWRHLQKTLKTMGHDAEAREIGIAHEEFRYASRIVGQLPPKPTLYDKLSAPLTRGLHRIYGALAGYGYKPLKLVLFSAGIWFICSWVYWFSALAGYLGPTNPIVFQNPKYGYKEKNCIYERQEFCISVPLDNWYWLPSLPAEYTTFSPMAYSLDLILPLVDLGQEKDWGVLVPTPKKVPVEEIFHFSWGHILRLIVWFEILWGWVASLMLVAVISGLVRNTRDDE